MRHAVPGNRMSKDDARFGACHHRFQRAFGQSNQAHAMVHTTWPQTPLGDFKTAAFAKNQIAQWYPHILKSHLGVTIGRVIVTKNA